MDKNKKRVGMLLVLAGIAAIIYVSVNLCLVGGIIQIVDGAKAEPTSGWAIVFGIIRMTALAGLSFWAAVGFLILPGVHKIRQKTIAEEITGAMGAAFGMAAGIVEGAAKGTKKSGGGE